MLDFFQQFKSQNEINENLFDKVLGKNNIVSENTSVPQFERGKAYDFNLDRLNFLGKFTQPNIRLTFKSPDDFKNFKTIMFYVNSGYLENDIHTLQKAVKYGEVDGYGPFYYLGPIFNNVKGKNIFELVGKNKIAESFFSTPKFQMPQNSKLKPIQKNKAVVNQPNVERFGTVESMKRLEMFVKYFIENIIDAFGKPNKALKNSLTSRLRKAIGANNLVSAETKPVVPAKTKTSAKVEPGAKPEDLGQQAIDFAKSGLRESISAIIKKINS